MSDTCRGAGAVFEAVNPRGRQTVQCGVCDRRFDMPVVRARRGVPVIPPTVTVPPHPAGWTFWDLSGLGQGVAMALSVYGLSGSGINGIQRADSIARALEADPAGDRVTVIRAALVAVGLPTTMGPTREQPHLPERDLAEKLAADRWITDRLAAG